jgi:hypothetical protein
MHDERAIEGGSGSVSARTHSPRLQEDGRQHMSVIDRTGQPLPDTHPPKNKALVILGQRPPTNATPESTTPATPNDTCTP